MSEVAAYNRVRAAMLLGAALLVVVITIAARNSGAGPTTPDAPVLQFAGAGRHFGEVAAGTLLRTRLRLVNAGGRRLVVNERTCALCDADALPTTIIGPGQSREIELTWDTAGAHGQLQQSRTFTTNDPRQPRFEVKVSGEVVPHSPDIDL